MILRRNVSINYNKYKNYSKQLIADNVKDFNSKNRDQNEITKPKQMLQIDLKHLLN
jgi:hypothetical protein